MPHCGITSNTPFRHRRVMRIARSASPLRRGRRTPVTDDTRIVTIALRRPYVKNTAPLRGARPRHLKPILQTTRAGQFTRHVPADATPQAARRVRRRPTAPRRWTPIIGRPQEPWPLGKPSFANLLRTWLLFPDPCLVRMGSGQAGRRGTVKRSPVPGGAEAGAEKSSTNSSISVDPHSVEWSESAP